MNSDQGHCAGKFLSAYAEGDVENIKRVAQSSTVSNLDHTVSNAVHFLITVVHFLILHRQEQLFLTILSCKCIKFQLFGWLLCLGL